MGAVAFAACSATMAVAGGLDVRARSNTNIYFQCNETYKKCAPISVNPVDADWPALEYTLYSDAVYKHTQGGTLRCLADKWTHYRIAENEIDSCRAKPIRNGIILLERFGPSQQSAHNIELQFVSFVFEPLDCTAAARKFDGKRWLEIRYDEHCVKR